MEEPFFITAMHNGKETNFEAQLQMTGYTHRFKVMVEDQEIFFERDEEGAYRAIVPNANIEKAAKQLDKTLLQAIVISIQNILA